jgi:hypothetical protein
MYIELNYLNISYKKIYFKLVFINFFFKSAARGKRPPCPPSSGPACKKLSYMKR